MTRLVTFSVVLVALLIAISFDKYKELPVSNALFSFEKQEQSYKAHVLEIKELEEQRLASLHPKKVEEKVVVAGPLVVLDTPQLVHGSELYKACVVCHGKKGNGKKSQKSPKIGGQMAWYINKQLSSMKDGSRINKVMNPYLKKLGSNDFKDLAAYISKLPW
jgi:cytochrome c553